MILRKLTTLLFLIIFSACSSTSKENKGPTSTTEDTAQKQAADMEAVEKKVRGLIDVAKKSGKHSINYLASDLYLKASAASKSGDSATAVFLYKSILEIYPDDVFVQKKYAIELIRTGDLATAKEMLVKIEAKEKGKDLKISFVLAGIYISEGDDKNARLTYKTILKNDPKNVDACVFLAKTYSDKKKHKSARSILSNCRSKNKADKGLYDYQIGKIFLKENKLDKAYSFFLKAKKSRPDLLEANLGLGLIHEEKHEYQKAQKVYQAYLSKTPENRIILTRLVNVMFINLENSSYKDILPFLERLIEIDPEDYNLKIKLGIIYSDLKRFDKAINVFEEIHKAIPESDKISYYLGAIHEETENYPKAIEYYQSVNFDSALYSESILQIAELLQKMASTKDVGSDEQEKFVRFVESKAKDNEELKIKLHLIKASYFENRGLFSRAIASLDQVANERGFGENQNYYLALLHEKNGSYQKSMDLMKKILDENPQNAHALNFLGYSHLEKGEELDLAYKYISKAVSILPEDGFIRDSLGWYYYKIGNYKKALKHLNIAYKNVNDDVVISKHLGMIHHKLKNYGLASKFYKRALQFSKDQKNTQELQQFINDIEKVRLPASN